VTRSALALLIGPEFDEFLCAPIGADRNGTGLSVLSALARLNVDPWQEATSLARMPQRSGCRAIDRIQKRGRGQVQGDQTGENHGHREDRDFDRNKQAPGIGDVGQGSRGQRERNNVRLTATCTRDTVIGLASRLVINQPDAVSNIAVPTFETRLGVRITVKARWMNGPQREGAGVVGAAAVVGSALKQISRRRTRAPPEATCQSTA
jgi:hypothetical protein